MKFFVGALLTTFGMFWGGEGVGVQWPGSDVAIVVIALFVLLAAFCAVQLLQRNRRLERTQQVVAAGAAE
jgi:uncharacterized membrane protein